MDSLLNTVNNFNDYLKSQKYLGWDPYDGLNSPIIQKTFLKNNYYAKLVFIQLLKKLPINFRPLLGIKKEHNPKGIALILSGLCSTSDSNVPALRYDISELADLLINLKSTGYSGNCWGYNFDWQSRAFFLPKYTPTIVVTSFAANALLNAYEILKKEEYLNAAISSADFIIKDLQRTTKKDGFIFSYSPYDKTAVYNASLLGSRLLARIYSITKKDELLENASLSVKACVNAQREDGSWYYGELGLQNWIDSFHTGYNLECIHEYQKYSGTNEYYKVIEAGFEFYINNFFLGDGTPKYYHNKTYPIDIHCPAQFIVTLSKLEKIKDHKELAEKVMNWTLENMYDKEKGYFYFQKTPYYTIKIPYMRWSQAWMFYALSYYISFLNDQPSNSK